MAKTRKLWRASVLGSMGSLLVGGSLLAAQDAPPADPPPSSLTQRVQNLLPVAAQAPAPAPAPAAHATLPTYSTAQSSVTKSSRRDNENFEALVAGRWLNYVGILALLFAIPDVLFALFLLVFAARTGWFPTGGMRSTDAAELSLAPRMWDLSRHLFLPVLALALTTLPILARHVRSAMIGVLDAPFLTAARSHGIPKFRLLYRHALPVALNSLISLFGFSVGSLLSISLLVEVILSWPGLGPLVVEAVLARDSYQAICDPSPAWQPPGASGPECLSSPVTDQHTAGEVFCSTELWRVSTVGGHSTMKALPRRTRGKRRGRAGMVEVIGVNLLLYGLIGPFAAALIDRFGVRRTMAVALAVSAASVSSLKPRSTRTSSGNH